MTSTFLSLAISKDGTHLLGHYGNDSSWHGQVSSALRLAVTLAHSARPQYNLYFDKLFGTEMFPVSLYEAQDSFYANVSRELSPASPSPSFPLLSSVEDSTNILIDSSLRSSARLSLAFPRKDRLARLAGRNRDHKLHSDPLRRRCRQVLPTG